MILGHLPAGYVAARLLQRQAAAQGAAWKPFLIAALLGAVAPDFDFLYTYLIDASRHHHAYVTHTPLFWGSLLLASALWTGLARNRRWAVLALVFTFNAFIHLCLDSIAGSIRWLAPFSEQVFALTRVPHVTAWRRLDYLLHWAAWLELVPILWAAWLWWRSRQTGQPDA